MNLWIPSLLSICQKLQEQHGKATKQGPKPRMELSYSDCFNFNFIHEQPGWTKLWFYDGVYF